MKPFLFVLLFLTGFSTTAQDFSKAMNNAFLVTRMVEKFHVQPRLLNDELSSDLFKLFIKKADPKKNIFLAEDINSFSAYQYKLDDEIRLRKTDFLQLVFSVFQKRQKQNDSIAQIILKTPFNFSLSDKINRTDSSYAVSLTAKQKKLYLHLKYSVLDFITDENEDLLHYTTIKQKKFVDSVENFFRKGLRETFQKAAELSLHKEKSITKTGNLFCKSLALCYDPHTEFMPLDEKEEFDVSLGQTPLRYGFELEENEKGEITVGKLHPGSAAFKNGVLKPGDRIVGVQETGKPVLNVNDYSTDQLDSLFTASTADRIYLTIKKPDGTTKQTFLFKERFSTEEDEEDKVQGYVLKGLRNIGYISVPDFYFDWENEETGIHGCANDVAKEIIKLKKENIEGLIIDVRYNGGGSVQEAIDLIGIFIDGGPVAQFKTKEAKVYTLKDVNGGSVFTGPMVVMVNGYSASASEMFSAAMQDYNRAFIAGTPTYGKATGQIIFPLDTTVAKQTTAKIKTDAYIKITTSALYRVNGTTAQQQGVVPDILLPDLLETVGEKEKDELFSFRLLPVEKNKYYKPYNVLNIASAKTFSQGFVDTSAYFKTMREYIQWGDRIKEQKEFSLKLDDMLMMKKKQQGYIDFFENFSQQSAFTVENDRLQKERLKASEWLTELDEETKAVLLNDPYLNICFQVLIKSLPQ
ncbi:MAG: S41 family peptidase [Lacibacter sp.]